MTVLIWNSNEQFPILAEEDLTWKLTDFSNQLQAGQYSEYLKPYHSIEEIISYMVHSAPMQGRDDAVWSTSLEVAIHRLLQTQRPQSYCNL